MLILANGNFVVLPIQVFSGLLTGNFEEELSKYFKNTRSTP